MWKSIRYSAYRRVVCLVIHRETSHKIHTTRETHQIRFMKPTRFAIPNQGTHLAQITSRRDRDGCAGRRNKFKIK